MDYTDTFLRGLSEGLTDWPLLIAAVLLLCAYRWMVTQRARRTGSDLRRGRILAFAAAIVIVIVTFGDASGWVRAAALLAVLASGLYPVLLVPLAVAVGYFVWRGTAPDASTGAHVGLLVLWEVILVSVVVWLRHNLVGTSIVFRPPNVHVRHPRLPEG